MAMAHQQFACLIMLDISTAAKLYELQYLTGMARKEGWGYSFIFANFLFANHKQVVRIHNSTINTNYTHMWSQTRVYTWTLSI